MNSSIKNINAIRIWDSRGNPTIETHITLNNDICGIGIAPSGASKGKKEKLERRNINKFIINDVTDAVEIINTFLDKYFNNKKLLTLLEFDNELKNIEKQFFEGFLGSNIMVSCSFAYANTLAKNENKQLWQYLSSNNKNVYLPLPEIQIFGGGAHANNAVDIQDYMIIPNGAKNYSQSLEYCHLVYKETGKILEKKGKRYGVADEGGYWPQFENNEEPLKLIIQAIENSNLKPGLDVSISIDVAANEFFSNNLYNLKKDNKKLKSNELFELIKTWTNKYPIISIEDPFNEDDTDSFKKITNELGNEIQIVGDDLLVTNKQLIKEAKIDNLCNTVLIKPNQIGTISDTAEAIKQTNLNEWGSIISARSGETEDNIIMQLAVGFQIKQIKVGSFSRSERMSKWNEGLRIGSLINSYSLTDKRSFVWNK